MNSKKRKKLINKEALPVIHHLQKKMFGGLVKLQKYKLKQIANKNTHLVPFTETNS